VRPLLPRRPMAGSVDVRPHRGRPSTGDLRERRGRAVLRARARSARSPRDVKRWSDGGHVALVGRGPRLSWRLRRRRQGTASCYSPAQRRSHVAGEAVRGPRLGQPAKGPVPVRSSGHCRGAETSFRRGGADATLATTSLLTVRGQIRLPSGTAARNVSLASAIRYGETLGRATLARAYSILEYGYFDSGHPRTRSTKRRLSRFSGTLESFEPQR
jgi:hypothetical protein